MARKPKKPIDVKTLTHDEAARVNIPTVELESVMEASDKEAKELKYPRNTDLDPQLVWRGKDEQDWSDLVVHAPPLYIQEKVHPKVLIDDLMKESKARSDATAEKEATDLFADFNGLPDSKAATEFYAHSQNWTNRMILGDSLQVMASLAEREGLRGQVQCIYFDPPYGIKFNSNFQWSTTSRDVKDGKSDHITREPEQVRAFRDTWRDGIHSYLTYLRDRLTVARDLLHDSGSIFVQIGDENVHRVRALMDEIYGEDSLVSQIGFRTTTGRAGSKLAGALNYILWYAKHAEHSKYRSVYQDKAEGSSTDQVYTRVRDMSGNYRKLNNDEKQDISNISKDWRLFRPDNLTSSRPAGDGDVRELYLLGKNYKPGKGTFKTNGSGLTRLGKSDRLWPTRSGTLQYIRYFSDFGVIPIANVWTDTGTGSFTDDKIYVVQTARKVVERCILMATDPGDLVLDPTCGSGTTAFVAEQWGRRWVTIDTSRVSLALARSRVMGARYPYYFLSDSEAGQDKEADVTGKPPPGSPTRGDVRHGFVYERVPHITLKAIANNAEIDVVWDGYQENLEPLRAALNAAVGESWEEWEIPRDLESGWSKAAKKAHADWWDLRIERQRKIDESIARNADTEFLYDKPYVDNTKTRVAGPFTVESLSPHQVLAVDEDDALVDTLEASEAKRKRASFESAADFASMVVEQLGAAGVQQAHKEDRISFSSVSPWPGDLIAAEGRYQSEDDGPEKRAAIFIGPEYGTVARPDLVAAAKEAGDCGFDVVVACAFNYDAHSSELERLGRIPILKARMNPDLHMADDLKTTGAGNLFVVFGEPDIDILEADAETLRVKINGVDVFRPGTDEIVSEGPDGIALWMIDTDYNEESFFVRHAYFLGANDPYKALKTTLKAEIDKEAWDTLNSDISRPFSRPKTGRIAVKVINHLGDEVMKVFSV